MWWVVLLIFWWNFEYINSLALRDTSWIKKQNIETPRTYRCKTNIWNNTVIFGIILSKPASLIRPLRVEEWSQFQTKYGIELPASIWNVRVESVENWSDFKYIISLTRSNTWYRYFRKIMSEIPGDNGSSLSKLITIKIIALTNITLIETSVLVVQP
jgi:hypothetical protein